MFNQKPISPCSNVTPFIFHLHMFCTYTERALFNALYRTQTLVSKIRDLLVSYLPTCYLHVSGFQHNFLKTGSISFSTTLVFDSHTFTSSVLDTRLNSRWARGLEKTKWWVKKKKIIHLCTKTVSKKVKWFIGLWFPVAYFFIDLW